MAIGANNMQQTPAPPMPQPWARFCVGEMLTQKCVPFSEVIHTTHIESGLNIVMEGSISPRLVFDQSILNQSRTLITWLSPKIWNYARYGNVCFHFDWNTIFAERNIYWLESVDSYTPPGCHILVTRNTYPYTPYDYTRRNGPWWQDPSTGQHYHNYEDSTVEIMFEDDLPILSCSQISFTNHHASWCSIHRNNPDRCSDLGNDYNYGRERFICGLMQRGLNLINYLFTVTDGRGGRIASDSLRLVFNGIYNRIIYSHLNYSTISMDREHEIALCRAFLDAYSKNRWQDAQMLATFFNSPDHLIHSLLGIASDHFGMPVAMVS